jgi:hypothetical protein
MTEESKTMQDQKPLTVAPNKPGDMVAPTDAPASSQFQELIEPVFDFLSTVPDEVGSFFSDYRKPLVTLLIFLSGIVTVYVVLSVLDAINNIPLLSPLLELVGLGYSAWFVYRYLLRANTRTELLQEFDVLKKQVVGKNSQEG